MLTKILETNELTGASVIREMVLPVPHYELGATVGFTLVNKETKEGVVTGYEIHVMLGKDDDINEQILYSINQGEYELVEEEIDYYYPEGSDAQGCQEIP